MRRKLSTATADRKSRDIAIVVPIVCVFLFMPPMVHLFTGTGSLFGIPSIVIYLFGVWSVAIILTAWNVRRLDDTRSLEALVIEPQDRLD